jgi:predicted nucleic acid-binding protein
MTETPSTSLEFCDTNVVVYAFDRSAGLKREKASTLLSRLWASSTGVVSVQVLQESFVVLTRRLPQPLSVQAARAIVEDLSAWRVAVPAAADVLAAIDLGDRLQLSLWDAMVVQAALKAGAHTLWSEDLSNGQVLAGVTVRNPFV